MIRARVLAWVFACLVMWLASCQFEKKGGRIQEESLAAYEPPAVSDGMDSATLARAYCGSCHLFPEPSMLPRDTWKQGVLPDMAARLGLLIDGYNPYRKVSLQEGFAMSGAYSKDTLIRVEDWRKIEAWYLQHAPDTLPTTPPDVALLDSLPGFSVVVPNAFRDRYPNTTMLHWNAAKSELLVGDGFGSLQLLDSALNFQKLWKVGTPPVFATEHENGYLLLTIGILNPSDLETGELIQLDDSLPKRHLYQKPYLVEDSLKRPLDAVFADLDGDGDRDRVVATYGNQTGFFAWDENLGDGTYLQHLLRATPGARKVYARDFNQDGRTDLAVLFAQGDERISFFYNQGKGQFLEKPVLRFPPVWGSSWFEFADFNDDGLDDILYAHGDNADYSFVLKPYHGLRIFLNKGDDRFEEEWFFPLYGAGQARAADFDADGDLDIASISFFADFENQPENTFVMLRNLGNLQFEAVTFPEATYGRWLTMELADIGNDQDIDILLGSLVLPSNLPKDLQSWWLDKGPPVLLLENTQNLAKPVP